MKLETKKGMQTTEFWLALAAQVMGILTIVGIFTPEQATEMQSALTQLAGAFVQGASALGYSIARGIAKGNVDPNA